LFGDQLLTVLAVQQRIRLADASTTYRIAAGGEFVIITNAFTRFKLMAGLRRGEFLPVKNPTAEKTEFKYCRTEPIPGP